jgi:hypothetical protein
MALGLPVKGHSLHSREPTEHAKGTNHSHLVLVDCGSPATWKVVHSSMDTGQWRNVTSGTVLL